MKHITAIVACLLTPSLTATADLELDPPGKPNESGHVISDKLGRDDLPLEQRFEYFAHYSPTIRSTAAASLRKEGARAMPFLIRGLQSEDRHVVRTSCDAISAVRSYAGVKMKDVSPITPEIAAEAVPQLVALLDRDDFYIQAGALQALSRCGKGAAPHLQKVAPFLAHDEWWVRASAAQVLQGVGSPEADPYAVDLARAVLAERHIMGLNSMTSSLNELMKTATTVSDVAETMGAGLAGMEYDTIRRQGLSVLEGMGTNSAPALPHVQSLVSEDKASLEAAEDGSPQAKALKADLGNLENALKAISGNL